METAEINFKESLIANGSFMIYNTTIEGAKQFELKRISSEQKGEKFNIFGHVFFPSGFSQGSFKSNLTIQFLNLPFVAQGRFNGTFKNSNAKFNISGVLIDHEGGLKKFKVTDFDAIFVVPEMMINLSGIADDENISE